MMFTFVDVFAGFGGIRQGMEKAGFKCIWSCENDEYARKAYKVLYGREPEGCNIEDVRISDLPEFDVLCAGFPCQPFSVAGHQLGFKDTRGTLFFYLAELLRIKHPKAFLLENVENLKNHDGGRTFKIIMKTLRNLGYTVYFKVLNGNGWKPQNRPRIFIVGFRDGLSFEFPVQPEPVKESIGDILEENVDEKYYLSDKQINKLKRYIKNKKRNSSKGKIIKLLPNTRRIREQILDSSGHSSCLTSEHEQIRIQNLSDSRYIQHSIYDTKGHSPALTTNHGAINIAWKTWRKLTPKEYGRFRVILMRILIN